MYAIRSYYAHEIAVAEATREAQREAVEVPDDGGDPERYEALEHYG